MESTPATVHFSSRTFFFSCLLFPHYSEEVITDCYEFHNVMKKYKCILRSQGHMLESCLPPPPHELRASPRAFLQGSPGATNHSRIRQRLRHCCLLPAPFPLGPSSGFPIHILTQFLHTCAKPLCKVVHCGSRCDTQNKVKPPPPVLPPSPRPLPGGR